MTDPDLRGALQERAELAAAAPRHRIEPFFRETAKEVLLGLARNPNLREQDLLRLLQRKDLPGEVIRQIAEHKEALQDYALKVALACHPRTPRLVSLPILRFLRLFDLVRVSHTPAVPADVKVVAEEAILKRVESLPRGEKITLARRSTGRVAAGLFMVGDNAVIRAALENPFLSEGHLVRALSLETLPPVAVQLIAHDEKWSHRYHVRLSLIRNRWTPLPRVLAFVPDISVSDLRDICLDRRMPDHVRKYILAHCAARLGKTPPPTARLEV